MKHLERYGIEAMQLDNGLQIILKKMSLPRVYCGLLVNCGSLYESEYMKGVSHFVEHLIGEEGKTRNRNSRLAYKISRDGGDLDASTYHQITEYTLFADKQFWFRDLRMFLDSIAELNFSREEFYNEQSRILAEIKEDSNGDVIVLKRVFPNHPLSWLLGGTKQSISAMSPNDIHHWYKKFYFPSRMVLVVVGDVSMKMIKRAVKLSQLYAMENGNDVSLPPKQDFNWEAEREIVGFEGNWEKMIYPAPLFGDAKDTFLYFLISNYLFGDISAISLNREVAYEMGSYSGIASELTITSCCSFFEIDLEASSQKNLAKIERRFMRWVKETSEGGIGNDMFRRLYLRRIADIKMLPGEDWLELISNAIVWGVMNNLEVFLDPCYIDRAELNRVMKKYFGGEYLVFNGRNS